MDDREINFINSIENEHNEAGIFDADWLASNKGNPNADEARSYALGINYSRMKHEAGLRFISLVDFKGAKILDIYPDYALKAYCIKVDFDMSLNHFASGKHVFIVKLIGQRIDKGAFDYYIERLPLDIIDNASIRIDGYLDFSVPIIMDGKPSYWGLNTCSATVEDAND